MILLLEDLVFISSTQLEAGEEIFRLESDENLTPNRFYENSLGRNMEEINNNNETEDGYMPMNASTIITYENERSMISIDRPTISILENNYIEIDDSNETTIVVSYKLNKSSVNEGSEHIYESFDHSEESIYDEITDNNSKNKSNSENKTDKHQKKQTKELNRTKNIICFFIGLFIGISLCTIYNVITYFYPIII
ncbi:hypothetical protein HERIO_1758 [Hepatospora eriocheir]|uniref:Uncharacterized protein n=1 Tax=Hepatospora eriocheir TaxID=1081669 RepID=A0A1X0Q9C8_9MICR|nr:hypothetical protein HERIO_1758 [Hepatospora eriocheir]